MMAYDWGYTAAITAATCTIGPIIPPVFCSSSSCDDRDLCGEIICRRVLPGILMVSP